MKQILTKPCVLQPLRFNLKKMRFAKLILTDTKFLSYKFLQAMN